MGGGRGAGGTVRNVEITKLLLRGGGWVGRGERGGEERWNY